MSEPGYTPPDLTLVGDEHVRRYLETGGEVGHEWSGVPHARADDDRPQVRKAAAISHDLRPGRRLLRRDRLAGRRADAPELVPQSHRRSAVEVQVGPERFAARARTAEGDERDRLWKLMTGIWPNFNVYQTRTDRRIPWLSSRRTS